VDARLAEEINMMVEQIEAGGVNVEAWMSDTREPGRWHAHLEGDGCFAGTTKETHAYLSGALAIQRRKT